MGLNFESAVPPLTTKPLISPLRPQVSPKTAYLCLRTPVFYGTSSPLGPAQPQISPFRPHLALSSLNQLSLTLNQPSQASDLVSHTSNQPSQASNQPSIVSS